MVFTNIVIKYFVLVVIFIRPIQHKFPLLGFCIKPLLGREGCEVEYISHTNPKGKVPAWATNKILTSLAPTFIRRIHDGAVKYPSWKRDNGPDYKPWINIEQVSSPKIVNHSGDIHPE